MAAGGGNQHEHLRFIAEGLGRGPGRWSHRKNYKHGPSLFLPTFMAIDLQIARGASLQPFVPEVRTSSPNRTSFVPNWRFCRSDGHVLTSLH